MMRDDILPGFLFNKQMPVNWLSARYRSLLKDGPALAVFIICLLVTAVSILLDKQHDQKRILEHANQDAAGFQRVLQEGANSYVRFNRYIASLFSTFGSITPDDFDKYIRHINALEARPALKYIEYVPSVSIGDLAKFKKEARKIFPAYEIQAMRPGSDFIYPLLYGYPNDNRIGRLRGFDSSSIPERWEAMQRARDSGKSIVTARHPYIGDPSYKGMIIIATPIYATNGALETIAQRRAALSGFIFSAFVVNEVITRVIGESFQNLFDLEIYDGVVAPDATLYDLDKTPLVPDRHTYSIARQENVDFAGRNWLLFFYPKQPYFDKYRNHHTLLILVSGIVISFALAFLTSKWQRRRHTKRLQIEQGQRFQAVFENHPSAVYSLDLQRRFINVNTKATEEFEIDKDKLIGLSVEQLIAPENREKAKQLFEEVLSGNAVTYDNTVVTGTGKRIAVNVALIPVSVEGKINSVLGIAQNITERRLAEWKLQESRQMLQLVIDNIPQRVFWKDAELHFMGCNKAFCKDAQVTHPDEMIGKTDYDFPWRAQAESYRRDDMETIRWGVPKINYEEPQPRVDGGQYWLRTSKIPLTNSIGETIGILGLYEDITDRKLAEQKLAQMAHYDSLTGLPNRAYFYDQLGQAINRSKRSNSLLGLMYFDIDKFKSINDTYGHDIGDAVIVQFAKRVKNAVREVDIVARLGGDEFCMIVEDLPAKEAVEAIATKLIEAMRQILQAGPITLQITTSIGIAFYAPGMAADEFVRSADHAMYRAKQAGRNRFELDW
jgi:diguanylate cyclase (GGDEF)-like protein/PAS domain S-box-containing protein